MSEKQRLRRDLMSCIDALETIEMILNTEFNYEKATSDIRKILTCTINDINERLDSDLKRINEKLISEGAV